MQDQMTQCNDLAPHRHTSPQLQASSSRTEVEAVNTAELDKKSHITIQKGQSLPPLVQCSNCCSSYHCPFCSAGSFKPTRLDKLNAHIKNHFRRAILHEGFTIHRCSLDCRPSLHYHCLYCPTTVLRRNDFENHLLVCKARQLHVFATEPPATSASFTASSVTTAVVSALPVIGSPPVTSVRIGVPPVTGVRDNAHPMTNVRVGVSPVAGVTDSAPPPVTNVSLYASPVTSVIEGVPSVSSLLASSSGSGASTLSVPTSTMPSVLKTQEPTTVYTGRVRVRAVIRRKCPLCNKLMNKCNLKKHIERKHTAQTKDINARTHLTSQCIDKTNGIFAVLKTFKGHSEPLHVQCKTFGEDHSVLCESSKCQVKMERAQRSGFTSHLCRHIKSVSYCTSSATAVSLEEDVLTEMVRAKWFGEEKKKICLTQQLLANTNKVPLSVHTNIFLPESKKCVSVYEPTLSSYNSLGRVMVVYNSKFNTWHCPCSKRRSSCIHKYVAKWHLFQTRRELFREVCSTEKVLDLDTDEEQCKESTDNWDMKDDNSIYPAEGEGQENMVTHILQNKKIPPVLPEGLCVPSPEKHFPKALCPDETLSQRCSDASLIDPILITTNAKILTNRDIIEDVATHQEWKDKLHNSNEHIPLDLPVCRTLRTLLQSHITIQKGQALPPLIKCSNCCSSYHCPFCSATSFKPTRLYKLNAHIKNHFKKAVLHEVFTIHRCSLDCRPSLHYHCLYCPTTVLRRNDFENHLLVCKARQLHVLATEPPATSASFTAPSVTTAVVSALPVMGVRIGSPPVTSVRVGVPPVTGVRNSATPVTNVHQIHQKVKD